MDFNARHALQVLRRRLPILLLCLVLAPAAAFAISALMEKEYTAKSLLLFRDPQFDQKLFGSSFVQTSRDPAREAATNIELVSLARVASQTAKRHRGMTQKEVAVAVRVRSEGQA